MVAELNGENYTALDLCRWMQIEMTFHPYISFSAYPWRLSKHKGESRPPHK